MSQHSQTLFYLPVDPNAEADAGAHPPAIYYRRPTVREAHRIAAHSREGDDGLEEIGALAQGCIKAFRGDWRLYQCGPPEGRDLLDFLTVDDFGAFLGALTASSRPTEAEGN
jgi:hypothetical protein